MSYRQFLDEAIGDSPVSTIDVDQVIMRQRRNRRLRRWGVCGGAAAAVLGVTATAALGLPSVGRQPAPAERPRITTVAGTPEDVARLDGAVKAAVERAVPGVTWGINATEGSPLRHAGDPRNGGEDPSNGVASYRGYGTITVNGVKAHLSIFINRQQGDRSREAPCVERPEVNQTCRESVGPNGERITLMNMSRVEQASSGRRHIRDNRYLLVHRPDDSLVSVLLESAASTGGFALTAEQLTAVGLDPGLVLAPLPPGVRLTPPASPSASPRQPSPQQKRIDNAIFAALRKQAPGVKGAGGASDTPTDLASVWTDGGGKNTADEYWGQGRLRADKATGLFSVQIWRTDPGLGSLTCGKNTKMYTCKAGTGPHGEKYRTVTIGGSSAERTVDVRRADGSWLWVNLIGDRGNFPLTPAQQQAIAFDPAIALAQ
ncbi:hypothetical protein ABZ783_05000 [Micromonospora sp. NPDC047738]|uniref:hypothetical protein n=1 Tax=Micromonospora sp. NPDC047738 TaxID=3155741 RepID=UPI0033DE165B